MTVSPTAAWREPFTYRGVEYTAEVPTPFVIAMALAACKGNEFLAKLTLVLPRLRRGDDLVFPMIDTFTMTPNDVALIHAAWLAIHPFTVPDLVDTSFMRTK